MPDTISEDASALINRRRRQILAHSCLYYRMDTSLIEDYVFDEWCRELVVLQSQYPAEASQVAYASDFEDFDGSSGFDLPYHRPEVLSTALRLLAYKPNN